MNNELRLRDKAVNWHPYTQMKTAEHIIPIVSAKGVYLTDSDGKSYIDAVSSWWVTLHGHSHPYIAQKVSEQLSTLEQVIFAGFTHKPAIELSERLLALLPNNQQKVFYTDNGSTAIEVGLKMCIQYWFNKKQKRSKVLAFKNAYHGDTFGAMSVSGRGIWTDPFGAMLFEVIFIDVPTKENFEANKRIIDQHADDIACFVYEPLVQGAAGMLMHESECLSELMTYCRSKNVLMIQDEIFVGFGRTGKLFAADHLTEKPDVMCFSKGLTGGTMPLGLTTCTNEIYDAFYSEEKDKALFHGHSFTASPLACTAAVASLDLLLRPETQDDIARIVAQHKAFADKLQLHEKVKCVRQTGTILALEWKTGNTTSYFDDIHDRLYAYFLNKGILLRPLGNIIYLLPPYCVTNEELNHIYTTIFQALDEV
ncbi:adenosylmethionine--8-amino-7-oxononanoate transaminase [Myroides phaeus]|uniref:Adenosylmethionine-8-amino-7-oxononanoate aminotransferase n=1 Tax=Myroides phaeus TaxID=702745 RepID=A0A1G8CKW7_9FLAO|nr:adenosylmethionine--8-amino-7-oxononanoate transaminase [Myroides phaeus]MEC4115990.1 adenosylmethionine--8-amino-7-oxononanoate transaminase [Myroides phaeus]SDH46026.1 adenosylmethionine-8-amino-7-oxononanoate aminotransferase [Myroides phaeus]